MAKIMLGIATLFIGEKTVCNAIAADMYAAGMDVKVCAMKEGDVFNVI